VHAPSEQVKVGFSDRASCDVPSISAFGAARTLSIVAAIVQTTSSIDKTRNPRCNEDAVEASTFALSPSLSSASSASHFMSVKATPVGGSRPLRPTDHTLVVIDFHSSMASATHSTDAVNLQGGRHHAAFHRSRRAAAARPGQRRPAPYLVPVRVGAPGLSPHGLFGAVMSPLALPDGTERCRIERDSGMAASPSALVKGRCFL